MTAGRGSCCHTAEPGARRLRGMALVAVLWIVAAISVLALGASSMLRQQISLAGAYRAQLQAQAAGEAAIALVLQQLMVAPSPPEGVLTVPVAYAENVIEVELAPLDGWVAINSADEETFTALLAVAADLPPVVARQLAQELLEWRDMRPDLGLTDAPGRSGRPREFEAVEDLLLVPGMSYDIYERIAPLVTADIRNRGLNLAAAPPEVLRVAAGGDQQVVEYYLAQRGRDGAAAATIGFSSALAGRGMNRNFYRLRAFVPLADGKMSQIMQDIALGPAYSRAAPWHVLRSDYSRRS